MGQAIILASWEHHFIIVHENLVQHPSNSISIQIIVKNTSQFSSPDRKCTIHRAGHAGRGLFFIFFLTGWTFLCLSVMSVLANHRTVMVFLYNAASNRSWEGLYYFGGWYHHFLQRKHPHIFFSFLKLKLKVNSTVLHPQLKCLQTRGLG